MTIEKFFYRFALVLLYGGIVLTLGAVTCTGCFLLLLASPQYNLPFPFRLLGNEGTAVGFYIASGFLVWFGASWVAVRAIVQRRKKMASRSSVPEL